jgi:DNA-binding response OmpR family regulator
MASVFLIDLENEVAELIAGVFSIERHAVCRKPFGLETGELRNAAMIFAGGGRNIYLPLLRRVRRELPTIPFVVVTDAADTGAWLEAIEAGATDYCCAPVARRQIQWLMQSIIPANKCGLDVRVPLGWSSSAAAD